MGFLSNLFGKKQSASTKEAQCKVEFDENGKVLSVDVAQGQWSKDQRGQNTYYSQSANSLLQATEILKKIDAIPPLTYYIVNTPDGTLGRDIQGFYTEASLKTKNLVVESRLEKHDAVEFSSLMGFGDTIANQTTVAHLKQSGEYARFILLMECGRCGYQSPVETQPGSLSRECYCCGTTNEGQRATINVFLGSSMVEI